MSIDVDRLARALGSTSFNPTWSDDQHYRDWAEDIAREYVRLAPADTGLREAAQAVIDQFDDWYCGDDVTRLNEAFAALRVALDAEAGR